MPLLIHQNATSSLLRRVPFHLVSAINGLTALTGATASAIQISKRGGAYVTLTMSKLSEVGNGLYFANLKSGSVDTLGFLVARAKSTKSAEAQVLCQVVPWNPHLATSGRLVTRVASIAGGAITATSLSSGGVRRIADTTLRRNLGNAATSADGQTASGRNLLMGTRKLVNRVMVSASLVVFKEDDTTVARREALTVSSQLATSQVVDVNPT